MRAIGVVLFAVLTVASVIASAAGGGGVCDGYAQGGGLVELLIALALGFTATFVWLLRPRRGAR